MSPRPVHQVRAPFACSVLGVFPAPILNRPMIARSKDFWHGEASVNRRPSIVRTFQNAPPLEGFCLNRLWISQNPWQKPDNAFDQDHRWDLTAGQYVVSDRNFFIDREVDDTLIDPLVAATDEQDRRPPGEF